MLPVPGCNLIWLNSAMWSLHLDFVHKLVVENHAFDQKVSTGLTMCMKHIDRFRANPSTGLFRRRKGVDMFLMNTQQLAGYFPESGRCPLLTFNDCGNQLVISDSYRLALIFLLRWSFIPPLVGEPTPAGDLPCFGR